LLDADEASAAQDVIVQVFSQKTGSVAKVRASAGVGPKVVKVVPAAGIHAIMQRVRPAFPEVGLQYGVFYYDVRSLSVFCCVCLTSEALSSPSDAYGWVWLAVRLQLAAGARAGRGRGALSQPGPAARQIGPRAVCRDGHPRRSRCLVNRVRTVRRAAPSVTPSHARCVRASHSDSLSIVLGLATSKLWAPVHQGQNSGGQAAA
jgi:hypothetical protein